MHMAINIAFAPILLYLVGIWALPPTTIHLVLFAISTALAFRYVMSRWNTPRLVISDEGIWFGTLYAAESIVSVQPLLRNLKLRIRTEEGEQDKMIGLGWARNEDVARIVEAAQSLVRPAAS